MADKFKLMIDGREAEPKTIRVSVEENPVGFKNGIRIIVNGIDILYLYDNGNYSEYLSYLDNIGFKVWK